MSLECQFITQSLQCKCYFCFLLKGFSLSDKAVETQHPENLSCSTSVISCASGTLPMILRALLHFSHNFSSCSNTLENCKTSRWHFWQIIFDTPIIFCCITSDDRTDDSVFKNSWLFLTKTLILDRPLVLKSILQILQKSLGTMLVSFSGVFIPGLLLGNTAANYPANSMLDPD